MSVGVEPQVMSPGRDHECAAPGCHRLLAEHLLMCRTHWLRVPQLVRDRVNAEYRRRPESRRHLRAVADAIASLTHEDRAEADARPAAAPEGRGGDARSSSRRPLPIEIGNPSAAELNA